MSARDSIANYPSRRREMTNYTLREIKKVSGEIGSRVPGEESERKLQTYVAESMRKVADTVEMEDFETHPRAFVGWITADAVILLLAAVFLILSRIQALSAIGTVCTVAALALTVFGAGTAVAVGLLRRSFLEGLFPKRRSCNVVCTRRASGKVKRRIVFVGGADSPYAWTYMRIGGEKLSAAVAGAAFAAAGVLLILEIVSLFSVPQALGTVILVLACIAAIPILLAVFLIDRKTAVLGANRNLTGLFSSMAALRYMAANDIRFENTEVVAVSLACSQAGSGGAKAYAAKHAGADVPETAVIVTDTLCDADGLCVRQKELFGALGADAQTAALLRRAGEIAGFDLGEENALLDATAAADLKRCGIRAAALTANGAAGAYLAHTSADGVDKLNPKAVEAGIDILLETAFLFDAEGLKDAYPKS